MKHFKLFVLLFALLVTASILYAQRQSSTASQPQQDSTYSTTSSSGTSWTCPMWGWGPSGTQARTSSGPYGQIGPSMMYGRSNSGQHGPMGQGMMYYGPTNPAQQSGNAKSGPNGQQ
jgi:hypothetical protein